MTAVFILVINMFIAGIFAVAFGVVAATMRTSTGARWMAAGYATGVVYVLLQFILPTQANAMALGVVIFLAYLGAVTLCVVGVARHYGVTPPWRTIGVLFSLSTLAAPALVTLYDQSLYGVALYQLPYATMQMVCAFVILKSGRRHPLDLLLLVLQLLVSVTYFARPLIGVVVGGPGTAETYIGTTYAAFSQTLGAVTLIALALVLLLVMMRDTTREMMKQSETDALSGVLNRRGFEDHAEKALGLAVRTGASAVLLAADLDHFKTINDRFGHAAGDRVIAEFAAILAEAAPEGAVVGRLGGEEFAVLLPQADLGAGRLYAETVRVQFRALSQERLEGPVSASFGVAQIEDGESLFDGLRLADKALYAAKGQGRDRVCIEPAAQPRLAQHVA